MSTVLKLILNMVFACIFSAGIACAQRSYLTPESVGPWHDPGPAAIHCEVDSDCVAVRDVCGEAAVIHRNMAQRYKRELEKAQKEAKCKVPVNLAGLPVLVAKCQNKVCAVSEQKLGHRPKQK